MQVPDHVEARVGISHVSQHIESTVAIVWDGGREKLIGKTELIFCVSFDGMEQK